MRYLSLKGVALEQSGVTAALRKEILATSLLSSKLKKKKKEITERGRETEQVKKGGKDVCAN